MHKTLYIDIDEEITSIIDRVRKAEAREIIIVAPKNAMLLQSIVNLKLLKKEADRRKKQLLIITQDKIGKKLIEKAGIQAQAKAGKDLYVNAQPDEKTYSPMYAEEAAEIKEELEKEEQEKEIGSNDYFDGLVMEKRDILNEKIVTDPSTKPVKEKKAPASASKKLDKSEEKKEAKTRVSMSDIVMNQFSPKKKKAKPEPDFAEKPPEAEIIVSEANSFSQSFAEANFEPSKVSKVSIKKAEKFFRGSRRMKKDIETARVGGGVKKYFIFFTGLFALFAALTVAYFLLPKATLALQTKRQDKAVSLDLTAGAQINAVSPQDKTLPANPEQISKEFSEDFDSTGTKDGGAKATGQAVIYNEFSPEDQPLVATTRLETDDGKIFHITKNVVVPGVTSIGTEKKPGAIEVDIIADQPGESYNIGPANFKIPGFKSTPSKYEKFYAKSVRPADGGSSGAAKVITAQDISLAKEKITADGKKTVREELKSSLSSDRKALDDAMQFEVLSIVFSDNAGGEKEKFSATVKIRASTLSFQESDVKKIIENSLAQSDANAQEISFDRPISYMLTGFDAQQKTLKFQAKTDANSATGLDLENFKKGILGKNAEEAQVYAKNFPAIQQMDVSFWPFFVNRIPMSEGSVGITTK